MKKLMLAAAAAAMFAGSVSAASAGCYRVGASGFHWYRHCDGPAWMYPHHKKCDKRTGQMWCWYS